KIGNAQHRCSSSRLPLVDRALSHDDIHWDIVGLRDVAIHSAELEADADGERPFLRRSECPVEISAAVTQAVMIMEAHERRDDSVGLDNFAMFGDGYVPEAPLDG